MFSALCVYLLPDILARMSCNIARWIGGLEGLEAGAMKMLHSVHIEFILEGGPKPARRVSRRINDIQYKYSARGGERYNITTIERW
jgi:hypothetical protein